MESRVMYQPSTGWITIHLSHYHAWQGHISDVPYSFQATFLICSFLQNGRVGKLVKSTHSKCVTLRVRVPPRLPTKETIVTEKVT